MKHDASSTLIKDPQALSAEQQLLDNSEFQEPDYGSLSLSELEELDLMANLAIVEKFRNFKEQSQADKLLREQRERSYMENLKALAA